MASATSAAAPIKPFPLSPVQARRQGMPGNLTKEQEIALKKFQQQVSCEETETIRARGEAVEVLHLKWLQAVEFDVVKSLDLWKAHFKWRVEVDVDILAETPGTVILGLDEAQFARYFPAAVRGFDKQNRPIVYRLLGEVTAESWSHTTVDKVILCSISFGEKMRRWHFPTAMARAGHYVGTSFIIVDLKNISMSAFPKNMQFIQKFSKIGAENFPESLGTTFVINAPYFFRMCWAAVTPFLSARTLAKFRILGSSFQSALLEQVDADMLPAEYGGTGKHTFKSVTEIQKPGAWRYFPDCYRQRPVWAKSEVSFKSKRA